MEIIVNNSAIRIDKYLSDNTEISRSLIEKEIKDGAILVNGNKTKPSYLVNINDLITIDDNYLKPITLQEQKMTLKIVYEDPYLLIIDKPCGLVVHPGSGNFNNTLVNGLLYYTKNLSQGSAEFRPGIVHRIDKDTTGLIMVAKDDKTHEILANSFKEHSIKRTYLALVDGILPHNKITIDAPIGRDKKHRDMMCVTALNSKKAITHLEVLKRYQDKTLVKLILETGRTHQIRVHMKYIGYPVFNDPVYGKNVINKYGQFLHSFAMEFAHPITKKDIYVETPLPDYFQKYLDSLKEL